MLRSYLPTSLEVKLGDILDELGLEYISQLPTHTGFIIDFAVYLDGRKVALEADGEAWHSSKEARKRDRFRDYQLRREGWEVLRIKGAEIDDPGTLKEKLIKFFKS